ncbi:DNA repair protein RadA [Synechococcus moorigangaii CMS01]|nr:DNA repair protein RadA [Synechococcus moorigangaii CMS01]
MAKTKTIYVCRECGATARQWLGKCPDCGVYGSLQEEIREKESSTGVSRTWHHKAPGGSKEKVPTPRTAIRFAEIDTRQRMRFGSGFGELDRVLGGGLVPGSLVLIGGDPGIGKSTLLLQVAYQLSASLPRILYVSAEESGQQIKLRGDRLRSETATPEENLYILTETGLEAILGELETLRPQVAVIDSIQTLYYSALGSAPGSVSQVRECTSALMQVAKRENITLFIVGHVTKEGAIAGPRVLEHLVDTVLYFEGDRYASHRLLRSVKNRFGATHEVGIFEMGEQGLEEVLNPSELFLGNREEATPGTATVVACEGTRPLLVELQALVSPTSYSSPRRSTTGVDYSRLQQILAVLEKRVGIPLSKLDAYVASAGGLTVSEPAVDLGMAVSLVASFRDRLVSPQTVLIGEVGLGGQIRPVSHLETRLKEAMKLGFTRAIVPKGQKLPDGLDLDIIPVARVLDAIVAALPADSKE